MSLFHSKGDYKVFGIDGVGVGLYGLVDMIIPDLDLNATRSDLNGDGTVDGLDLSQLLSEYEVSDNDPQGSTAAVATELPQFTDSASQTIIDPMASLRQGCASMNANVEASSIEASHRYRREKHSS